MSNKKMHLDIDGREFERDVADLYSLMGYKVERDKPLSSYRVDVYGEFRVGATLFRLAVECKSISRPVVTADVQKFAGTVTLLKNRGIIDKAIIVSRGSFTESARRTANKHGIELITYSELKSSIIDFSNYLNWLRENYAFRLIANRFVEPYIIGPDKKHRLASEFVEQWLVEESRDNLAILGNSGSGKTEFCRVLAGRMAKRYRDKPKETRIPILVDLRDYPRVMDMRQLITDLLVNGHGIHMAGYGAFEQVLRAGKILLILDGFDEMTRQADSQIMLQNIWELAEIMVPGSKVILTCRTHYFKTMMEERQVLSRPETDDYINLGNRPTFEVVYLAQWEEEQIKDYMGASFSGANLQTLSAKLHANPTLRQLAANPVLLAMIVKSVALLESSDLNMARLYAAYVDAWLERDVASERTQVDPQTKRLIMQELAFKMYDRRQLSIRFSELRDAISDHTGISARESDRLAHDIATASFLVRDGNGNYRFVHQSFMEFFIAEKLVHSPVPHLDEKKLPRTISDFLEQIRQRMNARDDNNVVSS